MDVTTQSVLARVRALVRLFDEKQAGISTFRIEQLLADVDVEIVRLSTRKERSND